MHRNIVALAFVLLVSGVSSAIVPIVKREPGTELITRGDYSSPVDTDKLFECPSGWKFFCFSYENESLCECYKMINVNKDCPENTNKYCSDYIKTECSCSYSKQPDCPPIFDFTCVASTSPSSTWTCTCAGRVWGKSGCPNGFGSACYREGCACKKITKYLSDYTPKPKSLEGDAIPISKDADPELKH